MRKISTKITVAIVLCCCITTLTLGVVGIQRSKQIIQKESQEIFVATAEKYANSVLKIITDIELDNPKAVEVLQELDTVGISKDEILGSMNSILSITEESASMVEEVNLSVEMQAGSMMELKRNADELKKSRHS